MRVTQVPDVSIAKHHAPVKCDGRVKCAECKYARPDKTMSDKNWTAYECTNPDSEFYKDLLNVTAGGNRLSRITWPGCKYGRRVAV